MRDTNALYTLVPRGRKKQLPGLSSWKKKSSCSWGWEWQRSLQGDAVLWDPEGVSLLDSESPPTPQLGPFTSPTSMTPQRPRPLPSQGAGGPVTPPPPAVPPRPSAPPPWGTRSPTLSAASPGHLKTSTRTTSSAGGHRESGKAARTKAARPLLHTSRLS